MKGESALEHHPFKLRVKYPPGYPYVAPSVEFLDPKIKRARHQGTDGSPCLFPPLRVDENVPCQRDLRRN